MIVEFGVDEAPLEAAFRRAPEMEVELEHLAASDSIPLRAFFWSYGDQFDAFEAGLDEDDGVERWTCLETKPGRRLYRVTHPPDLPMVDLYRHAVEHDAIIRSATVTSDGYRARMFVPDRDALSSWREACGTDGLSIDVCALYGAEQTPPERHHGLSEQQREALVAAADLGYFSIPRETSLAGLADQLGVSSQAASERLRRGMETLVGGALVEDDSQE